MAKTAKGKSSKSAAKITGLSKVAVKSTDLADMFGVGVRRIQQLTKEGVLSSERVGNENNYQLPLAVKQYIEYIGSTHYSGKISEKTALEEEKLRVEIDFKESKAKMARLELQELEGRYHRSEDVADAVADLVVHVRQALLAMPARISPMVIGAGNTKAATEIIAVEINGILTKLSDYRYNPDHYKQRVRGRKGWEDEDDDGDDGDISGDE